VSSRRSTGGPTLEDEVGDAFPGASAASAIPVSVLTTTAKEVLEGAFLPLWVQGEVTDFKAHRNGHWYFCLRDASAQVRCVVWARDTRRIPAPPDDGMQVVAMGRLTVYAARGEMQFTVSQMDARGDGLWRKALEITRQRLEADGLLAPGRKRALPPFPRTIAVVTSPDGAALRDIASVVRRRGAAVRLVVVPAAVQGETAVPELCAAMDRIERWGEAELVIIARGGGGREDLWAFNDERVARAVAGCHVPTISGVGHETDVTICDLVADVRAATPSAAAELATRSRGELLDAVAAGRRHLSQGMAARLSGAASAVRTGGRALRMQGRTMVDRDRRRIESVAGRLHALSPLATLARGYAVPRTPDGQPLLSVADYMVGAPIELVVHDGVVGATVTAAAPLNAGDAP
jgi:exodeoxyribonuclease VII large subunit